MSRLTGRHESGGHWAAASVLSVGAHALAVAWLLGLVPDLSAPPPPPQRQTVITLAPALEMPDAEGAGPIERADPLEAAAPDPETLAPDDPDATAETPDADRLAAAASEESLAPVAAPASAAVAPPDVAAPADVPRAATAPPAARAAIAPVETLGSAAVATLAPAPSRALPSAAPPGTAAAASAPAEALAAAGTEIATLSGSLPQASPPAPPRAAPSGPPPDPALAALVERIRARLDDACLIALPQPQPAPLPPLVTTLTDRDATGSAFARAVLQDPDLPVDHRDLLVDARQCPAVTFLRAAPRYPAFALSLSLARSQLASGEVLTGRIDGAAGAYTSLLLVDDNGVVQDLRRFLRFSGGRAEFSIPMTRDGPARETQALLIAMATPSRPEAVTRLAGRLAADVFPALSAQVGPRARLAVQPVDVR